MFTIDRSKMVKASELLTHETKKHSLIRFLGVLSVLVLYSLFLSLKIGVGAGMFVTLMTWSFFVLSTPIADAGFLLAFPVRIITGIRMMYTQLFAYVIAIGVSAYAFFYTPAVYNSTILLKLFHHILSDPYPFWGILVLSAVGTLLSIYFGDEMVDISSHTERKKYRKHINKYQLIIFTFLIAFTVLLYNFLLSSLGIHIPII